MGILTSGILYLSCYCPNPRVLNRCHLSESFRNTFAGCLTVMEWACRQHWAACEPNWWHEQEITGVCWMDTRQVNTIRGSRAFITLTFPYSNLILHYFSVVRILGNDAWKIIRVLNDVAIIAREKLQDSNGGGEAQKQTQTGTEQQKLLDQSGHLSFVEVAS